MTETLAFLTGFWESLEVCLAMYTGTGLMIKMLKLLTKFSLLIFNPFIVILSFKWQGKKRCSQQDVYGIHQPSPQSEKAFVVLVFTEMFFYSKT